MKKKWMSAAALLLLLLTLASLAACGNTDQDLETDGDLTLNPDEEVTYIPYESEEMGILLKLPLAWEEDYEITYSKKQDSLTIDTSFGGNLAVISREAGELFSSIDDIILGPPAGILGVNEGWTYYYVLPGDVQYDPKSTEEKTLYRSMAEELDGIFTNIQYLETDPPKAKTEGFKLVGTSYFTVEIVEEWTLTNTREDFKWLLQDSDGQDVGYFQLVPYSENHPTQTKQEVDGKDAWVKYHSDPKAERSVSLTLFLRQNPNGIGESTLKTLKFTNGAYNYLDLDAATEKYLSGGAEKITAKILSIEEKEDGATVITVEELDENMELTDVRRKLEVGSGATILAKRSAGSTFYSGQSFYEDYEGTAFDTNIFEITYYEGEVKTMVGIPVK